MFFTILFALVLIVLRLVVFGAAIVAAAAVLLWIDDKIGVKVYRRYLQNYISVTWE